MNKIKNLVYRALQSPTVVKAAHTFWQAALGVFVAGIFVAHSSSDVKALVIVAVAAGASAVKSQIVSRVRG